MIYTSSDMRVKISIIVTNVQDNGWYAFLLLLLAISSIGMFAYEFSPFARPEIIPLLIRLDVTIALIFMTDFFVGLFFSQKYSRREYWRNNWLDFISSIPITFGMLQALRILRVVRAIRVIASALDLWFAKKRFQKARRS